MNGRQETREDERVAGRVKKRTAAKERLSNEKRTIKAISPNYYNSTFANIVCNANEEMLGMCLIRWFDIISALNNTKLDST